MGTSENIQAWSKTAASNSAADSGLGTIADSTNADAVDNIIRGMMAAIAKYVDDTDGGLVAAGTANAITFNTNQSLSSGHIAAGETLTFRATATNTGATTLAPDGLSAVAIVDGWGQALTGGAIVSGDIVTVRYNADTSKWVIVSGGGNSGFPSKRASFSANKNGSDQNITTTSATKVTFGTEAYDVGGHFASNKWTPPAGKVLITARLRWTNAGVNLAALAHLYKNGSLFATGSPIINATSTDGAASITKMDAANGTDYYEIYSQVSDSNYNVEGDTTETWFEGTMI